MNKWEYWLAPVPVTTGDGRTVSDINALSSVLSIAGENSWELVTSVQGNGDLLDASGAEFGHTLIFKREKEEPKDWPGYY